MYVCMHMAMLSVRCAHIMGIHTYIPPDPMNHVRIFKGWALQDAPSKLVQLWYKSFPPGRFLPGRNEEANYVE